MRKITEAIKIICTVINTLYPILKDLRKKKAAHDGQDHEQNASQG